MKLAIGFVVVLWIALNITILKGFAQSSDFLSWKEPVLVSEAGKFSYTPFIVADQEQSLHAVWSQNDENINPEDSGLDAIYYASAHGGQWDSPMDIFVARTGGQAVVCRLRIDASDTLHLLWVGRPGITYATAKVKNAASARAWDTAQMYENAWVADFSLGVDGTIHLVYIIDRQGIYYIHSTDQGDNWSAPVLVWSTPDSNYSSGNVRLEVGPDNVLHVAWGVTSSYTQWNPLGIMYARSDDNGNSWNNTLTTLGSDDNLPNLAFDNKGGVHIVWDNPANSLLGRGHAWSTDGGKTWHIERLFPGYRGLTMWPAMALDSAGTLHLIFAANPPQLGETKIMHSQWLRDRWQEPEVVSGDLVGGEGPSIAISEGNLLNVIWFSYNPIEYGIWFTQARSTAPRVNSEELLPTLTPKISPTISLQPSEPDYSSTPTPSQTAITIATQTVFNDQAKSSAVIYPFALGAGISVILIILVFLGYIILVKNRH